jgi:Fusaric acid resistance protein-like
MANAQPSATQLGNDPEGLQTARSPGDIFERFIIQLGPSMKSLAYTLKQILDELPCTAAPKYEIKVDSHFHSSLVEAIGLYSNARKTSLALLYRTKDLAASRPEAMEADLEEVAASCGHFSYSLLNFAEEMKTYLNVLDELRHEIERPEPKRTWNWLKFWRRKAGAPPARRDVEGAVSFHAASPSTNGTTDFSMILAKAKPRRDMRYRIWKAGRLFRREDIKFAFKVGAGAAIYAMPSFVPEWRDFYSTWRGEWGLLSYMLVCSMTIGAANTTSAARIFGTIVGAICSIAAWFISGGNVYVLAFLGWLMSLWNFYIIVGKGQGPFGRFIMLTYNLTALYAYAISVKTVPGHEDEGGNNPRMGDIALHRVVAVISGCLWGMFITRVVWPISARRKFRDGLSLLLLRMGLIWKRDPLAFFLEGESQHTYLDLREELRLQKYLRHLEDVCSAASSEYHLKTTWQKETFNRILKAVGRMLDAFHAINVIINKQPVASEGEFALLEYTIAERGYLCRLISHLFQGAWCRAASSFNPSQNDLLPNSPAVLASSITLRFPLNDALPSTDGARDRLLARVFRYRKENNQQTSSEDEDYALLYAYGKGGYRVAALGN